MTTRTNHGGEVPLPEPEGWERQLPAAFEALAAENAQSQINLRHMLAIVGAKWKPSRLVAHRPR